MSETTHVLLWSGGFDSTAILLDMVSKPETYPKVRVVGCGLKNANNYTEDKEARIKISALLELDKKSNINLVEQELDVNATAGYQLPMWAWLSAINVSPSALKTMMVYGFIRGDDFWHVKHGFEQAVKHTAGLHSDGSIHFYYPLEWKYKKDFVNWYVHYPEVFYGLSWGGDTATIKAKEREELEFLYKEITFAHKLGEKKDEGKLKEETKETCHQDCACL